MTKQQNASKLEDVEGSVEKISDEDVTVEDKGSQEDRKTAGSEAEKESPPHLRSAESDMEETDESGDAEGIGESEEAVEGETKKGFFGKKKEKKDKKDLQIEELTDRLKRNLAEFDNYRKRTEKEKFAMYEVGAKEIIEKILPVVDNFERGLTSVPEEIKSDAFVEGMDKIYKQLLTTLEEADVKPIEALGNEFNPDFHNAVMHVEDEEAGESIVIEEYQKGYTYRGTVIRYSMVKVAN